MRHQFQRNTLSRTLRNVLTINFILPTAIGLAALTAHNTALADTTYTIPAGSLHQALTAFGQQSGLQVSYLAPIAAGKTSPGVTGTLSPEVALQTLLSDSNLVYTLAADGRTVTISNPSTEHADAAIDHPNNDETLLLNIISVIGDGESNVYTPYETPAPTSYISGETIERFRGSSPADIFRGTAGVMSGEARNGAGSVDVNIRGMQGMGRVSTTIDGAENTVTVYQGYQGVSNRSYIDPDFIAGIDITKGASSGSWGNAGTVAMRTLRADDLVKPDETWAIRVKGEIANNSSTPVPGMYHGYRRPDIPFIEDYKKRPTNFSRNRRAESLIAAYKGENIDLLLGYSHRTQGNYHAGKHGPSASPYLGGSNGRFHIEPGLANYRPGEMVMNTQLATTSWLAKATTQLPNDQKLELGYTQFKSEAGELLASRLSESQSYYPQRDNTSGSKLDTVTARYDWNPTHNAYINLKVNAYWSHLELRNPIRGGRWIDITKLGLDHNFRVGTDTNMWGIDISNQSQFYTSHGDTTLRYGAAYRAEDVRGSKHASSLEAWMTPPDALRQEAATFAQVDYTPAAADWLTLNTGLRYSQFWLRNRYDPYERRSVLLWPEMNRTAKNRGFSPSVGITVNAASGAQLYASYSSTIRSPNILESASLFNMMQDKSHIKPERSNNIELGANFNKEDLLSANDRVALKLGYFNWNVKNYISRVTNDDKMQPLIIGNIPRAKFSGLELSGHYENRGFSANVSANYFLNVAYCRTSSTCGSKSLYGDYATNHVQPKYTVDLTLSQKLINDRLTVGGRVSRIGPRAIGHGDTTARGAGLFIAMVDWQPYTLIDLFTEYKLSDNLTASLRVENLLDKFYVDPMSLVTQPGPGRTIYAGLTGTFNGGGFLPTFSSNSFKSGSSTRKSGDWSGAYVGMHFGLVSARTTGTTTALDSTATNTTLNESAHQRFNNGLSGLQIGYNWHLNQTTVFGLEADWSQSKLRGTQKTLAPAHANHPHIGYDEAQANTGYQIDWVSSLRARLGHVLNDHTLVYGMAGVAWTNEKQWREQFTVDPRPYYPVHATLISKAESSTQSRFGWTVGAGIERVLTSNWSVNANYAYTRFNNAKFQFPNARENVATSAGVNGRLANNSLQLHSLKIGVNYRF